MSQDPRVALITGGGSGIGAAIAQRLSSTGAHVHVVDRDLASAESVVADIRSRDRQATAAYCDVTDPQAVHDAVSGIVREHGRLDLAVNNAGVEGPALPLHRVEIEDFHRVLGVNLESVFFCMKYELEVMVHAGGGAIVNMSSVLGLDALPNSSAYMASKFGVTGLTKAAALDYARHGIRVNSVHPGFVDTAMLTGHDVAGLERLARRHALGRLGTADEVAAVVAFLLSDDASFITGSHYRVDGRFRS